MYNPLTMNKVDFLLCTLTQLQRSAYLSKEWLIKMEQTIILFFKTYTKQQLTRREKKLYKKCRNELYHRMQEYL